MTLVTHPATIKNDTTITLSQDISHLSNKAGFNYYQYLATLLVSTAIAFGVGCGLAATDLIDTPAKTAAAILYGVSK